MTVQNDRFNQQDLLAKDKIEASSYLIYSEKYRKGLSPSAVLMYQYIMKRFSISEMKYILALEENNLEDFTFIDEENNVFCYVSNDELAFVLNISEPTVIKCKKELKKVGLLEEVKQHNKTNRLYLNKITADLKEKEIFNTQLKEFRNKKVTERRAKNGNRDMTYTPKLKTVEPPIVMPEEKKKTLKLVGRVGNLKNLSSVNLKMLSSLNLKMLRQSTKEIKSTKEVKSTKESLNLLKHEEEEYLYKLRLNNIAYDLLFEFLNEKGMSIQNINETLKQCVVHGIEIFRVQDLEEQYKLIMDKKSSGIRIFSFPKYFAKGLFDNTEISALSDKYLIECKKEQDEWEANRTSVPFYNWLEDRN